MPQPYYYYSALHLASTIFNTAPGVKSLGPNHFNNTDILCLNETEVSPHTLYGLLPFTNSVAASLLQRLLINILILVIKFRLSC